MFEALVDGLDALLGASEESVVATVLGQLWLLVAVLGFAPHLSHCVSCGRRIPAGEPARFDASSGGLGCERCGGYGEAISSTELETLRMLVATGDGPPSVNGVQRRILIDFIRYHLAEGVHIRSLEFLSRGIR